MSVNSDLSPITASSIIEDGSEETKMEEPVNNWAACDPRAALHRYIFLIFLCFLGFGSYFCYDLPGALEDRVLKDMHISVSTYSLLYSLYSWPNVALSFFGGFLIDRVFGIRLGAIIFSLFILAGQLIFGLGGVLNSFVVMAIGRFVFGIGGESLAVSQNTYSVSWFKGKELNMVFGLQLSFARVGSTVSFDVMSYVYKFFAKFYHDYTCLGVTLFAAAATCVLSQICAFVLAIFDFRASKKLNREAGKTGDVIRLRDIRYFSPSFWLLTVVCVAYYVAIFPFVGLGTVFFQRKYGFKLEDANRVDSIIYLIAAIASPILGIMVDFFGHNLLWVLVASIVTLGSHMLLSFSYLHPMFGMVLMGLSYSLLACGLWPMVSLVIPEYQLGTAYGIMQSVQNLGLAVITMSAGAIVDSKGYFILGIFFQAWISVSIIAIIVLFLVNEKQGGILNLSPKARKMLEEQKLEDEQSLLGNSSSTLVTPHDLLYSSNPPDFRTHNSVGDL